MKVSKEQMAEHRARIIEAASQRFREKGFGGVSVAELMKEAGLTHGGFYNHFESKEELMSLAVERAFGDIEARWNQAIEKNPAKPIRAVQRAYLSTYHLEHPGHGCVIAALGSETSRQAAPIKRSITTGIESLIGLLASIQPERSKAQRRKKAVACLAQMVGALVLARSSGNQALADEVLSASYHALEHSNFAH